MQALLSVYTGASTCERVRGKQAECDQSGGNKECSMNSHTIMYSIGLYCLVLVCIHTHTHTLSKVQLSTSITLLILKMP